MGGIYESIHETAPTHDGGQISHFHRDLLRDSLLVSWRTFFHFKTTSEQELESLKQAVIRSSVQCYALEGFYPESLEYLEDHYGLTYDDDKYVVSYEVTASNLMPSIDVFALNETEVDFNEE